MRGGAGREISVKEFERADERRPEVPDFDIADRMDATETALGRIMDTPVLVEISPDSFQTGAYTEGILQITGAAAVVPDDT